MLFAAYIDKPGYHVEAGKDQINTARIRVEKEIKVIQNKVQEKYLKAIRFLFKMKNGENLTMELVDALIERIYVYPGKRIEVQFQYVNEILEGVAR